MKSKAKESLSNNPITGKLFKDTSSEIIDKSPSADIKKAPIRLMGLYLLLSALLLMSGRISEEIVGIEIFSFFILLGYGIRYKREKPFNWLLKIILILQVVLIVSFIMTQGEFLFYDIFSILIALSLVALFIVNIMLLIKGNKN